MPYLFDISPALEAIENSDALVEVSGLPLNQNIFDPGDKNGKFAADLPGGATVSSNKSVLIAGSVNGSTSNPCHIRVDGDLVVTGNVQYAQIRCRNFLVGGDLQHAKARTTGDATICGQLVAAELVLGEYEQPIQRVENLRQEIERSLDERESFDRQIGQQERRVDRSCKATRIPLNFNVSRLISQEHGRVRIDLSSFYDSLGDLAETRLKAALIEFFAKGIVGVLARANRKYIDGNPAREKVFLQLLKTLRELFVLVSERDIVIRHIDQAESEIEALVEELHGQACTLHVQQGLGNLVQLDFPRPQMHRDEGGDIDLVHEAASIKITEGNPGKLRLDSTSIEGEATSEDIPIDELQTVTLAVAAGRVTWESACTEIPS
ncbi:MAG: hypothetical protein QGH25_06980 [Candidatus Latescibacteria bacterium]|nr:hypothetical protein [Candidatus Latescibacterota bacterium]